ncbi:hypothetical protein SLEP1_g15098 [Rubroshorea leprosula]|uniref:Uncharacterized protein n=1 Tax=Rubroshorea leprosula TaxID=152421 RepID=A0AAV5IV71_9ROSI|nr:hypothetical protein SLEP1_g15098 [Rubroshorea leprosula]
MLPCSGTSCEQTRQCSLLKHELRIAEVRDGKCKSPNCEMLGHKLRNPCTSTSCKHKRIGLRHITVAQLDSITAAQLDSTKAVQLVKGPARQHHSSPARQGRVAQLYSSKAVSQLDGMHRANL